jgi:chemotaxis protein MotB
MSMQNEQPIIIKKVKKVGHAGHHGGAWKVAYADFVTAMMAFFMLLWLLNVTTEEQKRGIADYFAPTSASRSMSGSGGIMSGRSMDTYGSRVSDSSRESIILEIAPKAKDAEDDPSSDAESEGARGVADAGLNAQVQADEFAELEQRRFQEVEADLKQAIQEMPDFEKLAQHMITDMTPEGLRIQIVDQSTESMFQSGSADMYAHTRRMLSRIGDVVRRTKNRIAISGHTDSTAFDNGKGYTNWELSSDRAQASRRVLVDAGVPENRVASVTGKADQEPLFSENPFLPNNRRISIVLLREAPVLPNDVR